jgi:hypothetical protein
MFFYSLPIFFNDIGMISPTEWLFMTGMIVIVLFFCAPPAERNWQPETYGSFLLTSWLGGVSLHWAFWPFFLFLNAGLLFADQLAKTGAITVSSWDEIHFVLTFPIAWWITSVWRCSRNTYNRIWSALARSATVAVPIEYAIKLLIRIDYPRIFFNCEELLLDYGSCF